MIFGLFYYHHRRLAILSIVSLVAYLGFVIYALATGKLFDPPPSPPVTTTAEVTPIQPATATVARFAASPTPPATAISRPPTSPTPSPTFQVSPPLVLTAIPEGRACPKPVQTSAEADFLAEVEQALRALDEAERSWAELHQRVQFNPGILSDAGFLTGLEGSLQALDCRAWALAALPAAPEEYASYRSGIAQFASTYRAAFAHLLAYYRTGLPQHRDEGYAALIRAGKERQAAREIIFPPTPTPTRKPTADPQAEQDFAGWRAGQAAGLNELWGQAQSRLDALRTDPELVDDAGFMAELDGLLRALDGLAAGASEPADCPPRFTEADAAFRRAADRLQERAAELRRGIQEGSDRQIKTASKEIEAAFQALEEALPLFIASQAPATGTAEPEN